MKLHLNGAARATAFRETTIRAGIACADLIVWHCTALCRVHIAGAIFDSARVRINVHALLQEAESDERQNGEHCACVGIVRAWGSVPPAYSFASLLFLDHAPISTKHHKNTQDMKI